MIIHELMHAVGIQHEHQRKDRNTKINVIYANIQQGNRDQFDIEQDTVTYQVPYDYLSVMHYGKTVSSEPVRIRDTQQILFFL